MVAASVDCWVVRRDDQCRAVARMQIDQQIEDGRTRDGVEVAGRLVREQQRWIDDERSRNRDSLLLATGELRWQRIAAVAKTHLLK